ncbi:MAG: GDSL-type esterase/lipase family protein [Thermoanaerobaculia bacterium]
MNRPAPARSIALRSRLVARTAAALSCLLVSTAPALAALKVIAFGDSITQGYGDDSPQWDGGGYPARLQKWLRNDGYLNATVENDGIGGESTADGLSRIDDVLAGGGDWLILMEGSNDVTGRVSAETIRANLNQMASRAEADGLRVLHATVIPRWPTAGYDSDNLHTEILNDEIRDLAAVTSRGLADQFAEFIALPDVFDDYYQHENLDDPVGHPNGSGYNVMAGLFLDTLEPLLSTPSIQIVPPGSITAGNVAHFGVIASGASFSSASWTFGDGGFAAVEGDLGADYLYLAPGTYTVRVTAKGGGGTQASTQTTVTVGGTAPSWVSRNALLPLAIQQVAPSSTPDTTDLVLSNSGALPLLVDLAFFPEVTPDTPFASARVLVPAFTQLRFSPVLQEVWGLANGRGSLVLTFRSPVSGGLSAASASAELRLSSGGGAVATVASIPDSSWSNAQETVAGISGGPTTSVALVVDNLDAASGVVRLDLYDGVGAFVDSAAFELGVGEVRFRLLTDLSRALAARPQPFSAIFRASSIKFRAAVVASDPVSGALSAANALP